MCFLFVIIIIIIIFFFFFFFFFVCVLFLFLCFVCLFDCCFFVEFFLNKIYLFKHWLGGSILPIA